MRNRQYKFMIISSSLAVLSLTACGMVQNSKAAGVTNNQTINYTKSIQTMYQSDGSSMTLTSTYNSKGQNIETESIDDINGLGSKIKYEYDHSGNLIKSTSISADGTESSSYQSYDNHNNVIHRWSGSDTYENASELDRNWREYNYNDDYIEEIKDCTTNGQRKDNVVSDTKYEYDFSIDIDDTYLAERYGYGLDGGPWTTKTVYYPDNDYQSKTVRTYDFEANELTEVTTYSNEPDNYTKTVTDITTGNMKQMVYGMGSGNETSITYEYDDHNNIIKETYSTGEVYNSSYAYDNSGRIVEYITDNPDAYIVRYTETYE